MVYDPFIGMVADEFVLGRYRLVAELGHGGMADVFLAVAHGHGGFSKLTVIKRLRDGLAEDPRFVEMLLDEARLAAQLNHPNIVQTHEVDNVGHRYFIAMEYLDGQPLHRILSRAVRESHRFDPCLYYAILVDVLAGLHHAHEAKDLFGKRLGVVHRDVSPHNVFVTYDGQVKVVDFGIAKAGGRISAETQSGVIKGKVSYMAPEQVAGRDVDARADVFAVGVMLFEAAVGARLWEGLDEVAILGRLVMGEVPCSPREVNPAVPERIDLICRRALACDPDERYASAAEMQAALEQYLATLPTRPAPRDVGKAVANLFSDVRRESRRLLEAQLEKIRAHSGPLRPVRLPTEVGPLPPEEWTGSGTVSNVTAAAAVTARTRQRTKTTLRAVAGVVGLAVLGTAAFEFGVPRPVASVGVRRPVETAPPPSHVDEAALLRAAPPSTGLQAKVGPAAGSTPSVLAPVAHAASPAPHGSAQRRAPASAAGSSSATPRPASAPPPPLTRLQQEDDGVSTRK